MSIVYRHRRLDTFKVFYISLAQVCRIYDIPRGQLLGKLKGRSINDTNLIIV